MGALLAVVAAGYKIRLDDVEKSIVLLAFLLASFSLLCKFIEFFRHIKK